MKILKCGQIREADNYTIKNEPVLSIDLMERAALACTRWIVENFEGYTSFKIFTGPGNNGGDGLAIARLLADVNYAVEVFQVKISDDLSIDSTINLKRLQEQKKVKISEIRGVDNIPKINNNEVIIDCIFGSGLSRPPEGLPLKVIHFFNSCDSKVISIDIPSGLFGEDNSNNSPDNVTHASYTLSFQFPKLAFFFPENNTSVGEWHILPIGLNQQFIESLEADYYYVEKELIKSEIHRRSKYSHKGNFGHALLISGSYGKMGAAILASKACLRSGVGLLTTHVPKKGYEIIQTAVPEAMASIDKSDDFFSSLPDIGIYDAVGVGPGIGTNETTIRAFEKLIISSENPFVIDADGLNILARNKPLIKKVPANSILTPHPKEFERIAGKFSNSYQKLELQVNFSTKYNLYVVLKGAHTTITCPDGKVYFNSTGNPGMATAGSGDVLTGIILSLLAQGYESKWAAIIGVYLHGLAGDLAKRDLGEEALIANDIIDYLSKSFLLTK